MSVPDDWPGRWSTAAREALDGAGREARALGHHYVGTEHALLALASARRTTAGEVLAELGVSRERILATSCIETGARLPEPPRDCMPVMPRLKQALEQAHRIADGLGAPVADTEHLLAGILAVTGSMAVEILRRLGARPEVVRRALAERLEVDAERLGAPRRRRLLRISRGA